MENIVILGAGMAGFGAAHRVHSHGLRSTLYEKHPYHGGHTASFTYDAGFLFDEGPHVSFTSDERIQGLLAESVNDRFLTVPYRVNNYWRGHWIKHPAHCNLHGLPPDLVVNILNDFISAQGGEGKNVRNYAEWLIATYGEAFARTFPMEYTKKFHTTTADNMSTEWLGPRMYKPKLDEVIFGCISPKTPDYHYVTEFRYPDRGGFVSYFRTFLNQTDLYLGHELIGVNPKAKELRFANGAVSQYDALISSIPLPELVPLIAGVPADVLNAARRLACSACMLVNIGVNREDISENTVTYFYDQDMIFTRLSFPHLMSRNNVPPGAGSIQAEVYYSNKYRPLEFSPAECIDRVKADLFRCGLLHPDDRILFSNTIHCPYANVIFDLDRAAALSAVHGYLHDVGIAYCGRYGDWDYSWTDQAFKSGEGAAQYVLDSMID